MKYISDFLIGERFVGKGGYVFNLRRYIFPGNRIAAFGGIFYAKQVFESDGAARR